MTKRQIYELKENAAKVIFKNSNNTIHTYSKTCSGASQFFTKSLILQLKQNLPKDNYYEDNGSLKRDLSIETDYCILRSYYKKKRNTNREATSQKSKYSMNRTEIDTIDEYNNDTSACGDNEENFPHNTNININLTSLVVDNLKNLLNDWIRTYLLENNETKEKIETVLDSILHQLDLKRNDTPSSHTYTLDIEMDQNFHESESQLHKLQDVHKTPRSRTLKVKNKKSTLTIPLSNKHLKIISTLSLPKNIHKIRKTKSLKKFRHKRILLSTNNSSVYVFNSSNLDFLTLPTNSLIKHCAIYEENKCKNLKNKSPIEKINKEIISNIYKHIAGINNLSDYKSKMLNKKESLCISENNSIDPLVNVDLIRRSTERSDKENKVLHNSNFIKAKVTPQTKRKKSNVCKKRISKYRNYKNIKSKQYTHLFKKSNNYIQQEKELLQHFQSIFKYFSNYEGKHNFQLDIKVNISPTQEKKLSNSILDIDKEKLKNETTDLETVVVTDDNGKLSTDETKEATFDIDQNIISLLDGAASQTKYIISRGTSNTTGKDNTEETKPLKCNLKSSKVAREISELKIIVQSLATITEKLVNKHMDKKMELEARNLTKEKISKSVQFSNNIPKSQIISGLKLKKEPKTKITREFNLRLTKKSTSYKIIDSESILRVTDMTSAAEVNTATVIDEALTCSLPKSKSLFEVSVGPEKKLLAFYFDDFINTYPCHARHHNPSYISIPCRNTCHHIQPSHVYVKYNQNDCCDVSSASGHFQPENNVCQLYDDDNSSSSYCIDIDKSCKNKIKIRNRKLYFWEGLIYCILLWIPVLLLLWLFYVYAIEEMINPSQSKKRQFRKFYPSGYASKVSKSSFNLHDLGF
ncbi:unnamed protein product, partial [Brenthis ino]